MIKSLTVAISLLSMGLGVSYWEGTGHVFSLRGGDVLTKKDEGARMSSLQVAVKEVDDEDRLNEYNLSPYERHFPMWLLDPWMRKYVDSIPSKENEVCLVHVGKSAGYTVACALGFNAPGCTSQTNPIGLLPSYTTKWSHAGEYDCFDDSAYYLFIVRNPLDRAVSAFNYGKPYTWERARAKHGEKYYQRLKSLYLDCFDTIEQLAAWGLAPGGNATETCKQRAIDAIEGSARFENHLYYNFQYHLEMVPKDARIVTMRTEHLVEDWNTVEAAVGGEDELLGQDQSLIPRINTGSPKNDKYLSDESKVLVCERLCNEIQVYKYILDKSINLNQKQVEESLEELKLSCPVEAAASSCETVLPDITEKLMVNRGYDDNVELDPAGGEISVGRGVHRLPTRKSEQLSN
ncbi:hypothetical protein ACHAWO_008517 [Cyclotella atomus]|uniref:Sulfotransferase n=1 Tax=Cyclotella atomus TaxID=382360 RepID=A0ABD3MQ34_9STRA